MYCAFKTAYKPFLLYLKMFLFSSSFTGSFVNSTCFIIHIYKKHHQEYKGNENQNTSLSITLLFIGCTGLHQQKFNKRDDEIRRKINFIFKQAILRMHISSL